MNLPSRSPALAGPFSRLRTKYGFGSVAPWATGELLEDVLASPPLALIDAVMIATALSSAVAVLEAQGVAHGDLAPSNVMVRRNADGFFEVVLIDHDNASLPGHPAPTFVGQELYAAPELLAGTSETSLASDAFALAIVVHEVVLRRHPLVGLVPPGAPFEEYVRALQQVRWLEDPQMRNASAPASSGPPIEVLPRELHDLFRRAILVDPSARPSAAEWARAWNRAVNRVFACGACDLQFVTEATRYSCPHCGAFAAPPELRVGNTVISLAAMSVTIGRDDLGGWPTVSHDHVVFRRRGHALELRCLGRNGLAVFTGNRWVELAPGDLLEVVPGDRIRFARGLEGVIAERVA